MLINFYLNLLKLTWHAGHRLFKFRPCRGFRRFRNFPGLALVRWRRSPPGFSSLPGHQRHAQSQPGQADQQRRPGGGDQPERPGAPVVAPVPVHREAQKTGQRQIGGQDQTGRPGLVQQPEKIDGDQGQPQALHDLGGVEGSPGRGQGARREGQGERKAAGGGQAVAAARQQAARPSYGLPQGQGGGQGVPGQKKIKAFSQGQTGDEQQAGQQPSLEHQPALPVLQGQGRRPGEMPPLQDDVGQAGAQYAQDDQPEAQIESLPDPQARPGRRHGQQGQAAQNAQHDRQAVAADGEGAYGDVAGPHGGGTHLGIFFGAGRRRSEFLDKFGAGFGKVQARVKIFKPSRYFRLVMLENLKVSLDMKFA